MDNEKVSRTKHCSNCNRQRHDLKVRMNKKGNWTISCEDCAHHHGHKTRKELLGNIKIPDLSEHSKRVYKGEFLEK